MNMCKSLFIFLSVMGSVAAMEESGVIVFRNTKGQTIQIPAHIVAHSHMLQSAAHNNLLRSIGTNAPKDITLPDLQDFDLIQSCLEYVALTQEQLEAQLAGSSVLDRIAHFISVMEMSTKLNLPQVQKGIAQVVARQLLIPKNRCLAFKNKTFQTIAISASISGVLAQEIVKPAKNYWLSQIASLSKMEQSTAREQISHYINPHQALLLLDSYEHKTKAVPFSFVPGQEDALFKAFRPLVRPTCSERLFFTWKNLKPAYKWGGVAVAAAALGGIGYSGYWWVSSK